MQWRTVFFDEDFKPAYKSLTIFDVWFFISNSGFSVIPYQINPSPKNAKKIVIFWIKTSWNHEKKKQKNRIRTFYGR
jgi:hypothetical protein